MNDHIANQSGDFKVTAQEILRSDLSDGAKLAAIAELLGAANATDVACMLNKSVRTTERHYAELRKIRKSADTQICVVGSDTTQICVPEVRKSAYSSTQICVFESRARPDIDSRATKELPTEVLLTKKEVSTPLLAPQGEKTPSSKTKRGTRLPADWTLPSDWRAWVAVNCPAAPAPEIDRQALMFANYWQAQPGAKACKLSWELTWRNWALKAFSTAPVRPMSQAPRPQFMTAQERRFAAARAARNVCREVTQ